MKHKTMPRSLFLKYLLTSMMFLGLMTAFNLGSFAQNKHELSQSEFDLCKAKLERAHQGFYKLSYSDQYVRDVIMPSLRNERTSIAPHFPQRVSGTSSDLLFKDWMENHWEEYSAYMLFLNKQHQKWRLAQSQN